MSEERTEDIAQKYDTKPTIETILESIGTLGAEMRNGFARVEKRLEDFDVRLDRIVSEVRQTQSDFHALRADFNELKIALREHFPTTVK